MQLPPCVSPGVYVTLGHIRGRIVRADVCVENGILHYIDQVLGVPFTTVYEDIQRTDALLYVFTSYSL